MCHYHTGERFHDDLQKHIAEGAQDFKIRKYQWAKEETSLTAEENPIDIPLYNAIPIDRG